jgi:lipoprotein-releasing system permease protein
MQSVLTVLGVSVGVAVSIFIACLIAGVQDGLIKRIIGSLSQVTLEAKESIPLTMAQISPDVGNDTLLITRVERSGQKEARIGEWKPLVEKLDADRALTAVSPTVSGPGFAIKGNQVLPITFRGVEPERANKITDLKTRLKGGIYDVSGQNCVIGVELAKEMGLRLKDKLRTRSGRGRELVFTVTGIFDVGINEINLRSFYISLNNAQRLLDLVGYVNAIEMKVADIFQANAIADRLGAMSGLKQQSWMRQQKEFLSAFQAQNGSNNLIRVFMMLAVAFGIASVLVVSVVQKSREIGILKSMGARTRSIMLIFMIQGLLTGLIGSLVGTGLGVSLCWALMQIPGDNLTAPGQLFPMKIVPEYIFQAIGAAVIVGVVASIAPARRAATLDPVEVIRYG